MTTAKDFKKPKNFKINGVKFEMKLRVVGIIYLEDHYNKPISELSFTNERISDAVNIFVALALGCNPEMDSDEIKKKVDMMDTDQLANMLDKIPDLFGTSNSKNSQRPTKKKVKRSKKN